MKTIIEKIEGLNLQEYDDGSCVLLNSDIGIVHMLNTTAALLYRLCDKKIDKELLFEKFINEIDLSSTEITMREIRNDFEAVIRDFTDNSILDCKQEAEL